ncbi:hypothetical protein ABK040_006101 [Willaertia magna]
MQQQETQENNSHVLPSTRNSTFEMETLKEEVKKEIDNIPKELFYEIKDDKEIEQVIKNKMVQNNLNKLIDKEFQNILLKYIKNDLNKNFVNNIVKTDNEITNKESEIIVKKNENEMENKINFTKNIENKEIENQYLKNYLHLESLINKLILEFKKNPPSSLLKYLNSKNKLILTIFYQFEKFGVIENKQNEEEEEILQNNLQQKIFENKINVTKKERILNKKKFPLIEIDSMKNILKEKGIKELNNYLNNYKNNLNFKKNEFLLKKNEFEFLLFLKNDLQNTLQKDELFLEHLSNLFKEPNDSFKINNFTNNFNENENISFFKQSKL